MKKKNNCNKLTNARTYWKCDVTPEQFRCQLLYTRSIIAIYFVNMVTNCYTVGCNKWVKVVVTTNFPMIDPWQNCG